MLTDYQKNLLDKYPAYIYFEEKTISELIVFLEEKGRLAKMPLGKVIKSQIGCMIANIKHLNNVNFNALGQDYLNGYANNDLNFLAYEFLKCNENSAFYEKYHAFSENKDVVYVLFESTKNDFLCNNEKLKREIIIAKGINQCDYDNKTEALFHYLKVLDYYENKRY